MQGQPAPDALRVPPKVHDRAGRDMSMQFVEFDCTSCPGPQCARRSSADSGRPSGSSSRNGESKLVFRAEDVSTDKWIVPGACVLSHCTPLTLPSVFFSWVFWARKGCGVSLFLFTHVFHRRLDVYGVSTNSIVTKSRSRGISRGLAHSQGRTLPCSRPICKWYKALYHST